MRRRNNGRCILFTKIIIDRFSRNHHAYKYLIGTIWWKFVPRVEAHEDEDIVAVLPEGFSYFLPNLVGYSVVERRRK